MADEITLHLQMKVKKGGLVDDNNASSFKVDQATARCHKTVVTVGTSEEVLSFGDLTSPAYAWFRNFDTSSYVEVGPESGGALVAATRILAGQQACLPLVPSTTYRAKATGGNVEMHMMVLDL